ncbi:nucleotidyltransferase domain-containing protein [Maribellus luteus]|uniref:Nucleotidyltransferase domain-containing protein n=1 Tax=Maribellus luteus TaxID=2305463 RepID=A0A399SXW0_9BACT|nr:nucleotidyltransferase domain-containing protein [Maribellus luteus]RIJ47604.1 nucleotidyltransferase domain-containing protein [Maribellus luteus]
MRLTSYEIACIKEQATRYFGKDVKVHLFGSRTDDSKRGGDIDLFIQSYERQMLSVRNKIKFLAALKQQLGEQKIDVVLDNSAERRKTTFFQTISKYAVAL